MPSAVLLRANGRRRGAHPPEQARAPPFDPGVCLLGMRSESGRARTGPRAREGGVERLD